MSPFAYSFRGARLASEIPLSVAFEPENLLWGPCCAGWGVQLHLQNKCSGGVDIGRAQRGRLQAFSVSLDGALWEERGRHCKKLKGSYGICDLWVG